MGSSVRKKRDELFAQNPYCCWCGKLTRNDHEAEMKPGRSYDDTATLEHLVSKLDGPERWFPINKEKPRYAIACKRCNNERGSRMGREFNQIAGGLRATEFYVVLISVWCKVLSMK